MITQETAEKCAGIANSFITAHRFGEGEDVPEGTRYIMISDTFAKQISGILLQLVSGYNGNSVNAVEVYHGN